MQMFSALHLLQTLTKPNGMTLTQTYEQHRDLLTQMDYKRGNTLVARRSYQYDTLGRPTSRTLARQGTTRNDVFHYNDRSESPRRLVGGLDTPSQKKSYTVDGTTKKYVPNKNDVLH